MPAPRRFSQRAPSRASRRRRLSCLRGPSLHGLASLKLKGLGPERRVTAASGSGSIGDGGSGVGTHPMTPARLRLGCWPAAPDRPRRPGVVRAFPAAPPPGAHGCARALHRQTRVNAGGECCRFAPPPKAEARWIRARGGGW